MHLSMLDAPQHAWMHLSMLGCTSACAAHLVIASGPVLPVLGALRYLLQWLQRLQHLATQLCVYNRVAFKHHAHWGGPNAVACALAAQVPELLHPETFLTTIKVRFLSPRVAQYVSMLVVGGGPVRRCLEKAESSYM